VCVCFIGDMQLVRFEGQDRLVAEYAKPYGI
jgi:hypothetical protein